jgi:ubiquinone/menaquinone biosynthesis C-methylase UbiE
MTPPYALGSSDREHRRLMAQARILRPWTERFLRLGGLRPGMSVLDLGSGIGDVSLPAAEIVGPRGRVLGLDRDPLIAEKARARAAREGLADVVRFEVADLQEFTAPRQFDAVIGRYVLLFQRDPAAALRRFVDCVRPGGTVVFHDFDVTNASPSWPKCPVWEGSYRLLSDVLRVTGATPDIGRQLSRCFMDARLPHPVVESLTPVASAPGSPLLDWIAGTLQSLEPMNLRYGFPVPPEAGLDDPDALVDTWEKAMPAEGSQWLGPVQYGAWARVPRSTGAAPLGLGPQLP